MNELKIKIITTNNYKVLETRLKTADRDTLVIFDIDEVLLQPTDQLLKIYNTDNMAMLFKKIKDRLSVKQSWELESIILLEAKYEPVNEKINALIQDMQTKNVKVLALTQLMTGEFGRIKSLVDWRIEGLRSLGYDLNKSWEGLREKTFNQLPSIRYPESSPVFKDGVVFTCDHSKSKVLKLFLDYANYAPKRIIFIDDMEKHINDMKTFAPNHNIALLGIVYNASYDGQALEEFDQKLALLQLSTLEKEHKWISDQEANHQRS